MNYRKDQEKWQRDGEIELLLGLFIALVVVPAVVIAFKAL